MPRSALGTAMATCWMPAATRASTSCKALTSWLNSLALLTWGYSVASFRAATLVSSLAICRASAYEEIHQTMQSQPSTCNARCSLLLQRQGTQAIRTYHLECKCVVEPHVDTRSSSGRFGRSDVGGIGGGTGAGRAERLWGSTRNSCRGFCRRYHVARAHLVQGANRNKTDPSDERHTPYGGMVAWRQGGSTSKMAGPYHFRVRTLVRELPS